MANISNIKGRIRAGVLARFSEPARINGVLVNVIFEFEEFEDETGIKRLPVIYADKNDIKHFKKGQRVFVNNNNYVIYRIIQDDAELVEVELKRA